MAAVEAAKTLTAFRADAELIAAADHRAAADGVSRSDVFRQAISQYVSQPPATETSDA